MDPFAQPMPTMANASDEPMHILFMLYHYSNIGFCSRVFFFFFFGFNIYYT